MNHCYLCGEPYSSIEANWSHKHCYCKFCSNRYSRIYHTFRRVGKPFTLRQMHRSFRNWRTPKIGRIYRTFRRVGEPLTLRQMHRSFRNWRTPKVQS